MQKMVAIGALALLIGGSAVAISHNVSMDVSATDARVAVQLSPPVKLGPGIGHFSDEVRFIIAVQNAILKAAPINKGIPEGHRRELSDLVRLGYGLCYDRSRAIETVLRLNGFQTRHVSVYGTAEAGSSLAALISPGTESHALTEVKTQRGWMLVDSNQHWIGLTTAGHPVDAADLHRGRFSGWHVISKDGPAPIFQGPFTWVYGLYSRHGRFYPPYNILPDLNWRELAQNL